MRQLCYKEVTKNTKLLLHWVSYLQTCKAEDCSFLPWSSSLALIPAALSVLVLNSTATC